MDKHLNPELLASMVQHVQYFREEHGGDVMQPTIGDLPLYGQVQEYREAVRTSSVKLDGATWWVSSARRDGCSSAALFCCLVIRGWEVLSGVWDLYAAHFELHLSPFWSTCAYPFEQDALECLNAKRQWIAGFLMYCEELLKEV